MAASGGQRRQDAHQIQAGLPSAPLDQLGPPSDCQRCTLWITFYGVVGLSFVAPLPDRYLRHRAVRIGAEGEGTPGTGRPGQDCHRQGGGTRRRPCNSSSLAASGWLTRQENLGGGGGGYWVSRVLLFERHFLLTFLYRVQGDV